MDWAEKIVQAGTNPPLLFLFFVVSGSLVPLSIVCGQTVRLKPICSLLTYYGSNSADGFTAKLIK